MSLRVFSSALQHAAKNKKENEIIRQKRQEFNRSQELFDLKKKQAGIELKEAEMSGKITEFEFENQKKLQKQKIDQYKKIQEAKKVMLDIGEQKTNNEIEKANKVGLTLLRTQPDVQQVVSQLAQQSIDPALLQSRVEPHLQQSLLEQEEVSVNQKTTFDPSGNGYDYKTAQSAGMQEDEVGHMGEIVRDQDGRISSIPSQQSQQQPQQMTQKQSQDYNVFDVPYNERLATTIDIDNKGRYIEKVIDREDYYLRLIDQKKSKGFELNNEEQQFFDEKVMGKEFMKRREEAKLAKNKEELANLEGLEALRAVKNLKEKIKYFGPFGGRIHPIASFLDTDKVDWDANLKRLKGLLVLDKMARLKQASKTGATGFGQLSNKELMLLENSATALKPEMSEEDALRYLNEIEEKLENTAGLNLKDLEGTELRASKDSSQQGEDHSYLW